MPIQKVDKISLIELPPLRVYPFPLGFLFKTGQPAKPDRSFL